MIGTAPIPHLVINDAEAAIDFYTKAFGAVLESKVPHQDGKRLMHAHLTIGGGPLFLVDDFPEFVDHGAAQSPARLGGSTSTIHLVVPDADVAWERAIDAGAESVMELDNTFWGDRYGIVRDPFGHYWSIGSPINK